MVNGSKNCPGCDTVKLVDKFSRCASRYDNLQVYCKECQSARRRAYREANLEKVRAGARARGEANREKEIARSRAKRLGGRDPLKPWPESPCGYLAAHRRVESVYGLAKTHQCATEGCDSRASSWSYNYQDPDEYSGLRFDGRSGSNRVMRWSGDPSFYSPLCHSCHTNFDREMSRKIS